MAGIDGFDVVEFPNSKEYPKVMATYKDNTHLVANRTAHLEDAKLHKWLITFHVEANHPESKSPLASVTIAELENQPLPTCPCAKSKQVYELLMQYICSCHV